MLRSLHCVALRTIKYNEKHSILSAYSLEMRNVSFLSVLKNYCVKLLLFNKPTGILPQQLLTLWSNTLLDDDKYQRH